MATLIHGDLFSPTLFTVFLADEIVHVQMDVDMVNKIIDNRRKRFKWINENLQGEWAHPTNGRYQFVDKEEATLFKLRWC